MSTSLFVNLDFINFLRTLHINLTDNSASEVLDKHETVNIFFYNIEIHFVARFALHLLDSEDAQNIFLTTNSLRFNQVSKPSRYPLKSP